ncbi:surface lipoprotein assembly modifier [Endothiovibrio diazotrophicus]
MIKRTAAPRRWLTALVLASAVGTSHASPELLSQARELMAAGQADAAYQLLVAEEATRAGELEFDYLLGIAALDAGHPEMATLSLERVLAVNPRHAGARLDLGRAWFAMGDLDRAETELRAVQGLNPPAAASRAVTRYLAAIEQRRAEEIALRTGPQWSGYLAAGFGYDSNVNNSTDQSTIFAPLFGVNLQLSATNVESDDGFFTLAGGGQVTYPLREGLKFYAGADAERRNLFSEHTFDTGSVSGRVGLELSEGNEVFRLGLDGGRYYQDDRLNRDLAGISAEWRHSVDADNLLAFSAQYAAVRYDDAVLATNDIDQSVIGASWLHALGGSDGKTILFANLYGGREDDTNSRADGNKDLLGGRIGIQHSYSDDLSAFASLGLQEGDYDRRNLIFLTTREDQMADLRAGFDWGFKPDWSLLGQIAYTRNDSNIQIYEYDRAELSLTVRRDF